MVQQRRAKPRMRWITMRNRETKISPRLAYTNHSGFFTHAGVVADPDDPKRCTRSGYARRFESAPRGAGREGMAGLRGD
jgi:hypothetical protein